MWPVLIFSNFIFLNQFHRALVDSSYAVPNSELLPVQQGPTCTTEVFDTYSLANKHCALYTYIAFRYAHKPAWTMAKGRQKQRRTLLPMSKTRFSEISSWSLGYRIVQGSQTATGMSDGNLRDLIQASRKGRKVIFNYPTRLSAHWRFLWSRISQA